MRKLAIFIIPLLILALIAGPTGCGEGEPPAPTPTPSPTATPVPTATQTNVDASYNGGEVEVAAGGTIIVTLESNPSTGFSWALAENTDEGVLEEAGNEFQIDDPADPPIVGAGGHEIWTFKALKKGTSTISMEYSRPWEGGEKGVQTFELTVVVE